MGSIQQLERGEAFEITELILSEDQQIGGVHKKKGRYVTLGGYDVTEILVDREKWVAECAEELGKFIPKGRILVVGIGNRANTPDSLGPRVVDNVFATKHLKSITDDEFMCGLREVVTLEARTMGQSGVETFDIVNSVKKAVRPKAVIAIDSLSTESADRLGTTIQISDAGFSPGSGSNNTRKSLNSETLGLPVIVVGVPMVLSLHNLVSSLTGSEPVPDTPNIIVTTRDIDRIVERSAKFLSCALNLALQPLMTLEMAEHL